MIKTTSKEISRIAGEMFGCELYFFGTLCDDNYKVVTPINISFINNSGGLINIPESAILDYIKIKNIQL